MRNLLGLIVVAFAVTLAIVVGNRMSAEAMAVVVGIVCGVLASIPMSVIILILTHRSGRKQERQRLDYPPVVVVNPGTQSPIDRYLPFPSPSVGQSTPREFKVVGEDDDEWSHV